ncbi:hypothetical protein [Paractinoplanes rishiriensis]|uniref:Uncharacterized protein n=1 Tax=Paractinoplanes rishiriensis TaxID=1050105 RepID=A0A919JUD2_9ACTN|nr:hypothetical protein [Actinoplanes rishiriensis]GIE94965.1 hypothetical protein Ari01nite_24300 [Actinoplanes rishiriensis]
MRRVSLTAALFAAAVAVAFTAACGGSSDDSSGTTANPAGGFAAYTECMQKNGVTITMPSGGPRTRPSGGPSGMPRPDGSDGPGFPGGGFRKPEGIDDATWEKAQTACAALRPEGRGGPDDGGNGRGRGNGANVAYLNCLRENGVTTPPGQLNTTDPTVQKAVAACKVLQPQASPSPSA